MAGKKREVEVAEKQGERATNMAVVRMGVGGVQGQEKGGRERERERHTPKRDANTVTDTKPLVSSQQ